MRDKTLKGNLRIKEEKKDFSILHHSLKWYTKVKKQYDLGIEVMKKKPDEKDWKTADYGLMILFKQLYFASNLTNGTQKSVEMSELGAV